jgi:hypothetical protein
MGTDVDPIRMLLVVLPLILAFQSYDHHNLALLIAAVASAALFGWWVTRAWYLDQIDDLKKEVESYEEQRSELRG